MAKTHEGLMKVVPCKWSGDSSSVLSLTQFGSVITDITNISEEKTIDVKDGEKGPEQLIKPHSYKSIKDSEYFRTEMVRKKTTRKLPKNQPKNTSGLSTGKQPWTPILKKPLRTGV